MRAKKERRVENRGSEVREMETVGVLEEEEEEEEDIAVIKLKDVDGFIQKKM